MTMVNRVSEQPRGCWIKYEKKTKGHTWSKQFSSNAVCPLGSKSIIFMALGILLLSSYRSLEFEKCGEGWTTGKNDCFQLPSCPRYLSYLLNVINDTYQTFVFILIYSLQFKVKVKTSNKPQKL